MEAARLNCQEGQSLESLKCRIGQVCRGEYSSTLNSRWIFKKEGETLNDLLKKLPIVKKQHIIGKYNLNTLELIDTYSTTTLAAKANGCDPSSISKVCRGVRKQCGGYFWKYIEN